MKTTVKNKIDLLESLGYKVHLKHHRRVQNVPGFPVHEKGGCTQAVIKDEYGNRIAETFAVCSSQDNYNKKIGANIALGRALRKLEIA